MDKRSKKSEVHLFAEGEAACGASGRDLQLSRDPKKVTHKECLDLIQRQVAALKGPTPQRRGLP